MDTPKSFVLLQDGETPALYDQTGRFYYRVAYSRSSDSRSNSESGQDYLTYCIDDGRFAFALCDGVSQSFYGNLAAHILGEKLLEWAWTQNFKQQRDQIQQACIQQLNILTDEASRLVRDHPIPEHVPPMLRAVLDKKRVLGSESTFIAGVIDFSAQVAGFVWMGDSRLKLWLGEKEISLSLENQFQTSERWSSVKGPVGNLHLTVTDPSLFDHLAVYSDGFSFLDAAYQVAGAAHPFSNHAIDAFIADAARHPSSDDISFLEIWTTPNPPQFPTVGETLPVSNLKYGYQNEAHFLSWTPVVGANEYEIRLSTENKTTISSVKTDACKWQNSGDLDANARFISARAWHYQEPGDWSDFLALENTARPVAPPRLVDVSPGARPPTAPLTSPPPQPHAPPDNPPVLLRPAVETPPPAYAAPPPPPPARLQTLPNTLPHATAAPSQKPAEPPKRNTPVWLWGAGAFFVLMCFGAVFIGATVFVPDIWASSARSSEILTATPTLTSNPIPTLVTPTLTEILTPELGISPTDTETVVVMVELTGTPTPTLAPTDAIGVTPTDTPSLTIQVSVTIKRSPYVQIYPFPGRQYEPRPGAKIYKSGKTVVISRSYITTRGDWWYFVRAPDKAEGWLLGDWLNLDGVDLMSIPVDDNIIFPTNTPTK